MRLERWFYSDYIKNQAKEVRHHFCSGWKLLNTLVKAKVMIYSSLVRKMTWQHLNQLLDRGKRLNAIEILKIKVDLKEHEPYNWQGLNSINSLHVAIIFNLIMQCYFLGLMIRTQSKMNKRIVSNRDSQREKQNKQQQNKQKNKNLWRKHI